MTICTLSKNVRNLRLHALLGLFACTPMMPACGAMNELLGIEEEEEEKPSEREKALRGLREDERIAERIAQFQVVETPIVRSPVSETYEFFSDDQLRSKSVVTHTLNENGYPTRTVSQDYMVSTDGTETLSREETSTFEYGLPDHPYAPTKTTSTERTISIGSEGSETEETEISETTLSYEENLESPDQPYLIPNLRAVTRGGTEVSKTTLTSSDDGRTVSLSMQFLGETGETTETITNTVKFIGTFGGLIEEMKTLSNDEETSTLEAVFEGNVLVGYTGKDTETITSYTMGTDGTYVEEEVTEISEKNCIFEETDLLVCTTISRVGDTKTSEEIEKERYFIATRAGLAWVSQVTVERIYKSFNEETGEEESSTTTQVTLNDLLLPVSETETLVSTSAYSGEVNTSTETTTSTYNPGTRELTQEVTETESSRTVLTKTY